jgi:hypothetical protein
VVRIEGLGREGTSGKQNVPVPDGGKKNAQSLTHNRSGQDTNAISALSKDHEDKDPLVVQWCYGRIDYGTLHLPTKTAARWRIRVHRKENTKPYMLDSIPDEWGTDKNTKKKKNSKQRDVDTILK